MGFSGYAKTVLKNNKNLLGQRTRLFKLKENGMDGTPDLEFNEEKFSLQSEYEKIQVAKRRKKVFAKNKKENYIKNIIALVFVLILSFYIWTLL